MIFTYLLKISEFSLFSQNKLLSESKVENEFSKFGLWLTSITVQYHKKYIYIQYQNWFYRKEKRACLCGEDALNSFKVFTVAAGKLPCMRET